MIELSEKLTTWIAGFFVMKFSYCFLHFSLIGKCEIIVNSAISKFQLAFVSKNVLNPTKFLRTLTNSKNFRYFKMWKMFENVPYNHQSRISHLVVLPGFRIDHMVGLLKYFLWSHISIYNNASNAISNYASLLTRNNKRQDFECKKSFHAFLFYFWQNWTLKEQNTDAELTPAGLRRFSIMEK